MSRRRWDKQAIESFIKITRANRRIISFNFFQLNIVRNNYYIVISPDTLMKLKYDMDNMWGMHKITIIVLFKKNSFFHIATKTYG